MQNFTMRLEENLIEEIKSIRFENGTYNNMMKNLINLYKSEKWHLKVIYMSNTKSTGGFSQPQL